MIQNLAEAIKNKDWDGVLAFYESFAGVKLETDIPQEKKTRSKKEKVVAPPVQPIQPVVAARTRGFLRGDFDFSVVHGKPKASKAIRVKAEVEPARPPKKARKSSKTNAVRQNKFDEIVPTIVIDEPGSDKVRDDVPLTPRNRKPFKLKKAKCELCSKTFEIAPVLYRENWKCDTCCLKANRGTHE